MMIFRCAEHATRDVAIFENETARPFTSVDTLPDHFDDAFEERTSSRREDLGCQIKARR